MRILCRDFLCFGIAILGPYVVGGASASAQETHSVRMLHVAEIDGYSEELVPVDGVVLGPSGSIIVSQGMDRQVRLYSPSGVLRSRLGARGDGPGEFRVISRIGLMGELVWVADSRTGRLTLFNLRGDLVGTRRLPVGARSDAATWGFSGPLAVYPDSSYLAILGLRIPPEAEPAQEYAHIDHEGQVLNPIAATIPPRGFFARRDGASVSNTLPFQHRVLEAVSAGGEFFAIGRPVIERGEVDLTLFLPNGDTVFTRRLTIAPDRIPDDVRDDAIRDGASSVGRFGREYRDQAKDRVPYVYPFLEGLAVTSKGEVWAQTRELGTERLLRVFATSGVITGVATAPANAVVQAAGDEHLVFVRSDEFDVPDVLLFRVDPPR